MRTRRQALATIATLAGCAKANKNRLNVFNWSAYVAPETIPNFEKEFGVTVRNSINETKKKMNSFRFVYIFRILMIIKSMLIDHDFQYNQRLF